MQGADEVGGEDEAALRIEPRADRHSRRRDLARYFRIATGDGLRVVEDTDRTPRTIGIRVWTPSGDGLRHSENQPVHGESDDVWRHHTEVDVSDFGTNDFKHG